MVVANRWSFFLLAAGAFAPGVHAELVQTDTCLTSPNRPVYYRPTPPTTLAPVPEGGVVAPTYPPVVIDPNFCECADKSKYIEGDGKVTGGGWLYLTEKSYFSCRMAGGDSTGSDACSGYNNVDGSGVGINQTKVNYGFVAMFRHTIPRGSTNFDMDGKNFHFHSDTRNTPYKFLEVLPDGIRARWFGVGSISTKHKAVGKSAWTSGYCFMVSVEDFGEPGYQDTFRLRIWDCTGVVESTCSFGRFGVDDLLPNTFTLAQFVTLGDQQKCLVFDTNYIPGDATYLNDFPLPSELVNLNRFNGTEVGELGEAHGGGNIQIHIKNKANKYTEYMQMASMECAACPPDPVELDSSDTGFITGGGFIFLDEQAYMKPATCTLCERDTSRNFLASKREAARKSTYDLQQNAMGEGQACESVDVTGLKANYGFNAKFIGGVARGSFNFDISGNGFHFHSESYDCLEIVCNDKYGSSMIEGGGRWTGIGRVYRTLPGVAPPPLNDAGWVSGYRFYVAAVDAGEPGYLDTIRLKIEDTVACPGQILFDTNMNNGEVFLPSDVSIIECPTYTVSASVPSLPDPNCGGNPECETSPDFNGMSLAALYDGTQVGIDDTVTKGGGNIQIHCKGGPSRV